MPSKTYYPKKKKYYKKRTGGSWLNTIGGVAKVASTAMSIAKGVASIVNAEDKLIDTDISGFPLVGTTNSLGGLTLIAQGDNDNQRNGNSILAKSVFIRIRMQMSGATNTFGFMRVIVFIDNMQLGTLPTVTDVLQTNDVGSPLNIRSTSDQRFTILKDHMFKFAGGQENQVQMWKLYKPLTHHIKYGGSTASQSDQRNGNLYILYVTQANTETFTIWQNARVRFYDN